MAAGRPQGAWKGGTEAANELARFLREATESLTVREMAERYGGGKTAWGQYRSGERIIPLGRLNTVIRDRVRDGRGREAMLKRARRLHDAALTADMRKAPAPGVDEALRRAEADLAESGRLVQSLLAVITMLQETIPPLQAAPTAPTVGQQVAPEPEPAVGHLDEAFEQLGTALALRTTARMVHADAHEQSLAARPVADGSGEVAKADRALSLGLAQVRSALEHRRQDVRRLWQEIQEGSGAGRAVAEEIVLERTDTSSAAAVTLAREAGAPSTAAVAAVPATPAGGRGRGLSPVASASAPSSWRGREGRASFIVLLTACALSVITAATAAAIAIGRPAVTAPTVYAAPPPGLSPGAVIPGGTTAAPSPSGATAPAATTSPTASGSSAPPQTTPTTTPPVGSLQPSTPERPGPTSSGPQPSTPQPSHPVPSSPPSTTSPPPQLPDGFFRLSNAVGGMCLSGPDDSPVPSDGIVQTVCGANPEQFWQLTKEGTGPAGTEYSIRNRNGGLCLSVDAGRTTNDAFVTEFLCGEGDGPYPDQFWIFRYDAPHHAWQLVNRNSGKCVLVNTDGGDGEQARQNECGDDARMLWQISPAR